jgi:hypothetical protein
MNTYVATARWKVKRADTAMMRTISITASTFDEAQEIASKELSSFITRNKAVLIVQKVES